MTESLSHRRLAENEVAFKQANQQVIKELNTLKESAKADGHESLFGNIDMPLHFYCECADEDCRQRIVLKPSEYKELHQNTSQFVVLPGHVVPDVERIAHETNDYTVVEKYETPPDNANKLNPTNLQNS